MEKVIRSLLNYLSFVKDYLKIVKVFTQGEKRC